MVVLEELYCFTIFVYLISNVGDRYIFCAAWKNPVGKKYGWKYGGKKV